MHPVEAGEVVSAGDPVDNGSVAVTMEVIVDVFSTGDDDAAAAEAEFPWVNVDSVLDSDVSALLPQATSGGDSDLDVSLRSSPSISSCSSYSYRSSSSSSSGYDT